MYGKEFQNLRGLLKEKYWHLVEEEEVHSSLMYLEDLVLPK